MYLDRRIDRFGVPSDDFLKQVLTKMGSLGLGSRALRLQGIIRD